MKTEDAFMCETCGATFRDSDALEKHRRVHQKVDDSEIETSTQGLERPALYPEGIDTPMRTT